jgi:hypothetical protein
MTVIPRRTQGGAKVQRRPDLRFLADREGSVPVISVRFFLCAPLRASVFKAVHEANLAR